MREILDNMSERIIVLDRDGKVSYANRSMLKMCGLREGDVLGKACDRLPKKCLALGNGRACPRPEVFESGRALSWRYEVVDEQGWKKTMEVNALPIEDTGGNVVNMMEIIREVTEQSKIEELLERSAEGMTVLYELSSGFLSSRNLEEALDTAFSLIGDYYGADCMLVGVPDEEGRGLELIAGSGWGSSGLKGLSCDISREFMEGYCVMEKCPAIVTDFGAQRAFRRSPLFEEHGIMSGIGVPMVTEDRVLGVLCILYKEPRAIDTAELWYLNVVANSLAVYIQKERSLQKLEESEGFLFSVLEAIGEGVVVVDRDMNVISANKAFLEITRMSLEDVRGRHCYEVSHGSEMPCYESGEACTVKGVFDTGMRSSALHTHYDRDRNPIYVQTHAYPIKDNSGRVVAAVETVVDVTERVKLERDLEKRVRELEEFYEMAVGRELRMIELKEEIARLREELARKISP